MIKLPALWMAALAKSVKSNKIKEEDVQKNADPHIDQDFPGFPHLPSNKKSITPNTVKNFLGT